MNDLKMIKEFHYIAKTIKAPCGAFKDVSSFITSQPRHDRFVLNRCAFHDFDGEL